MEPDKSGSGFKRGFFYATGIHYCRLVYYFADQRIGFFQPAAGKSPARFFADQNEQVQTLPSAYGLTANSIYFDTESNEP